MLSEPSPTPLDLNFRLFGVPVRVSPWFWVVSAFLGWSNVKLGLSYLLLWIASSFISILIHELGHVAAARVFGSRSHIVLFSFGGLAIPDRRLYHRWQRIVVFLAGPLVQFPLYGLAWYAMEHYSSLFPRGFYQTQWADRLYEMLDQLAFINLWWPILNLLPIWPLDGGRVTRELFEWVSPREGARGSLWFSLAFAALIALNALFAINGKPFLPYIPAGGQFAAIMFALFAVSNYLELQQLGASRRWVEDHREPWEQDPDFWKR